ncbi:MAG: hypothetical protein AAB652_00115 [Patescibacteria group bacterium]
MKKTPMDSVLLHHSERVRGGAAYRGTPRTLTELLENLLAWFTANEVPKILGVPGSQG